MIRRLMKLLRRRQPEGRRPRLSIIVVVYDMNREAPRTLRSLTAGYQRGVTSDDYEVIVMDNGSPNPLDEQTVRDFGPNFRYKYVENAKPSPVFAINEGVAMSSGEMVGIWIDGARIASPGILQTAMEALEICPDGIVSSIGYHLGPTPQQESTSTGYDKAEEDRLLDEINFPECDYRLFEICAFAGSSKFGAFLTPAESNAVFLRRKNFDALGGYDENFDLPGGGLANHDFFARALAAPGARPIIPLGEGTFHQLHGGISTNVNRKENDLKVKTWIAHYEKVRGKPWGHSPRVKSTPLYIGELRKDHIDILKKSVEGLEVALGGKRKSGATGSRHQGVSMDNTPAFHFLGIGAQKTGTSWLHDMLQRHPEIALPEKKEIHFWDKQFRGEESITRYERLMRKLPGTIRGEITPAYAFLNTEVIERIRSRYPELKILYIMRDPLERAWSHAKMVAERLHQSGELPPVDQVEDAWFETHIRSQTSIIRGDYHLALRNWRSVFEKSAILQLYYDDLCRSSASFLAHCMEHIGADPSFADSIDAETLNKRVYSTAHLEIRPTLVPCLLEIYRPKLLELAEYLDSDVPLKWLARYES